MGVVLTRLTHALYGSLLGQAIGDAYGLPFENLSPRRMVKFGVPTSFMLVPVIQGAMVSDDTEHAVMTVQAYIRSGGEIDSFERALKRRLMLWFLSLPAGVGLATARSIIKMFLGVKHSGVFSAGNGAAMRASVLGVLCDDIEKLKQFVAVSSRLTHTDPKAEQGALTIALLAWAECRYHHLSGEQIWSFVQSHVDSELVALVGQPTHFPKGVSGYMYHTVPAVVQTWQTYRHRPVQGMQALLAMGGDTDTTCAIFGGITGVCHADKLQQLQGVWCEPKLKPSFFFCLAGQAAQVYDSGTPQRPARFGGVITFIRNLLFLLLVLLHGFRRLLPPY